MSRLFVAEWFATFILVFGGTGVVAVNVMFDGTVSLVGIALTWGLLVAILAYSVGPVSGAHMNPAVTVGLAVAGQHSWRLVPLYIGAQCVGALTASGLLWWLTQKAAKVTLAPTEPFHADWVAECFVLEMWLTGVLVFVVLCISTGRAELRPFAGFIVGGVICLEVLFGGPVTGASMNPARSLGPAVVGEKLEYLWLYLTAPVIGAIAGVVVWKYLHPLPTVEDAS